MKRKATKENPSNQEPVSGRLEQERKREEERSTGRKLNEKDEMAFRRKKAVK